RGGRGDDEPQGVRSGKRRQSDVPVVSAIIEDALVAIAERVPLYTRLHARLGEVIENIRREFDVAAWFHQLERVLRYRGRDVYGGTRNRRRLRSEAEGGPRSGEN